MGTAETALEHLISTNTLLAEGDGQRDLDLSLCLISTNTLLAEGDAAFNKLNPWHKSISTNTLLAEGDV